MLTTTRTDNDLFGDVTAEAAAIDLIMQELGGVVISQPSWREFDDREAYEDQLSLDLEAAGLFGSDW